MIKNFLDLEVPYGLSSDGYMVRADDAEKEIIYLCPQCEEPLVLKAGEYMVRHFAHKANTQCSGESIIHKTAKMLIAESIRNQADPSINKPIDLHCICNCCNSKVEKKLPREAFTSAQEEKPVDGYICDVVAQKDDKDILAIEILFTHKVDEIKAKNLSLHWIELTAESVLSNPYSWSPTQFKLKEVLCKVCKEHLEKLNKIIKKWDLDPCPAALYKDTKRGSYLAEIETCWKCKEEIPVYWWDGVPFCETQPPEPKPRTIKFKPSKAYGGSYWVNTCANCGSIQGDNFLFLDSNGKKPVIRGLPLLENKAMRDAKEREATARAKSITDIFFRNRY